MNQGTKGGLEMKIRQLFLILMIVFSGLFFPGTIGFSQQNAGQLFEKALYLEEAKGELQGAIDIYNQIVDNKSSDPAIQAKALLHMGICYEKLGMKEATMTYQRLISNFSSYKNEVALAKERLSKLLTSGSNDDIVVKQIWSGPGPDGSFNISEDGVFLTFTNWETGNLAIRNLKTDESRQLTKDGTFRKLQIQYAEKSLISPDAKQVAYLWYNDRGENGIYELRLLQTAEQTQSILHMCANGEEYLPEVWYSGSDKFIFQTFKSNKTWQLYSMDVSGKETNLLLQRTLIPPLGSWVFPNVALSKDEKFIAYDYPDSSDNGMYDIYLISAESKSQETLVDHPGNDRLIGWLPGRDEFLFTSNRSGKTDIWAVNTATQKSFSEPKLILPDIGEILPVKLTRDGSLFYRTNSRLVESFIVSLDGKEGVISSDRKMTVPAVAESSWLPDGESIICRPMSPQDQLLTIYNIRTGEKRTLAENIIMSSVVQPRISPDGKSVLIVGVDKLRTKNENERYHGIFSVDIKSGIPVEIKVNEAKDRTYPKIINPSVEWDKDGTSIFYVHNHQIIKHNIMTKAEKTIYTDANEEYFHPTLRRSFDGQNLIFDAGKKTDTIFTDLLIIPTDGGEVRKLCTIKIGNPTPMGKRICISPDGQYIYFSQTSAYGETNSNLQRVPFNGGMPQEVWKSKDYFLSGVSIHPDGKQIVLSIFGTKTEIREIQNLGKKVAEIFSEDK